MQPFERLRTLARWGDGDDDLIAEVAECLVELADDAAALVVACRRLLHHHRDRGRLWWLCSRVLAAPRPEIAAMDAADRVRGDATVTRLAARLPFPPDGVVAVAGSSPAGRRLTVERPDLELVTVALDPLDDRASSQPDVDPAVLGDLAPTHLFVEPAALGVRDVVVPVGLASILDVLPAVVRVWAVAPVGSVLPAPLLDAIARACGDSPVPMQIPLERVAIQRFDRVAGPRGLDTTDAVADRDDTPVAPELLRPLP